MEISKLMHSCINYCRTEEEINSKRYSGLRTLAFADKANKLSINDSK